MILPIDNENVYIPKVSIIVPIYNVANFLRPCLESIINQSLHEIEIICGDGGSTDGSIEIVKEYAQIDQRIKLISKAKSGYGQSMNDCIRIAKGKYVGIVESDDLVHVDMYKDLCSIADKTEVDIVKADFCSFYFKRKKIERTYHCLMEKDKFYGKKILIDHNREVFRSWLTTWSGIYRRDFLLKYEIKHHESEGGAFQDIGFWFKTMCYAKSIFFVRKPYYYWRQDNPNSSVKRNTMIGDFTRNEYINLWSDVKKIEKRRQNIDILCWRQYCSYMWVLDNIAPERKKAFLLQFITDFKSIKQKGLLETRYFSSKEKETIELFLDCDVEQMDKIIAKPIVFTSSSEVFQLESEKKNISNVSKCFIIKAIRSMTKHGVKYCYYYCRSKI